MHAWGSLTEPGLNWFIQQCALKTLTLSCYGKGDYNNDYMLTHNITQETSIGMKKYFTFHCSNKIGILRHHLCILQSFFCGVYSSDTVSAYHNKVLALACWGLCSYVTRWNFIALCPLVTWSWNVSDRNISILDRPTRQKEWIWNYCANQRIMIVLIPSIWCW